MLRALQWAFARLKVAVCLMFAPGNWGTVSRGVASAGTGLLSPWVAQLPRRVRVRLLSAASPVCPDSRGERAPGGPQGSGRAQGCSASSWPGS